MKSLFKWVFAITLSVVVLAAIGISLLLFVINLNNYKPHIQQLASDNGIDLQINGDLNWQLLPDIAITVGNTRISGHNLPGIQFQQASLSLDLDKLIGGDIAVNKIAISKPLIRLEMSDSNAAQQAVAIAAAPLAVAQQSTDNTSTTAMESSMALAINSLTIQNGTVEFLQNGKLHQRIENLNINGQQLNFNQQPFPFSLGLTTSVNGIAEQLSLSFNTQVIVDQSLQKLSMTKSAVNIAIESSTYGNHQLNTELDATIDLIEGTLDLPSITINLDGTPILLKVRTLSLTDTVDIQGLLEIPPFAPQQILTAFGVDLSAVPIKQLALKTQFASKGNSHRLDNFELVIDDFSVTGMMAFTLAEQRTINATLNGTHLNLDRYLPAGEESAAQQQQVNPLFAPLLVPLAVLNGGKGQIKLTLAQLMTHGVRLNNVHLNTIGNGPIIHITDASATSFGGKLQSSARMDMSTATPKLTFNLAANGVDMGRALTTLADFKELSGHGNLNFTGSTQGSSSDDIFANLKGSGNFHLSEPYYSAINIEQQFCMVAGKKGSQPENWPTGSRLKDAKGSFTINGQTLALQQLHTGVGNLNLKGTGDMELLDGLMDMTMTFNISNPKSSAQGCTLRSQSIQNQDIPIHLQGHKDHMSDMITNSLITLIARMAIDGKQGNLLNKLFGFDKGDKQQESDNKQPEDSKDPMKNLLKDLLKK